MKKFVLMLIKFYQKYLSSKNFGIHACIFEPSCSEYVFQAVQKYGIIKGLSKGFIRILKCNPFAKGGFDPLK